MQTGWRLPFQPRVLEYVSETGRLRRTIYAPGSSEAWKRTDSDGRPQLRLEWWSGELWLIDPDDVLINVDRRGGTKLGIYGFDVRGLKYHRPAARSGDFSPGRRVELVREPANKIDPNAVAVRALGASAIAGYVNKQLARTVARLLDGGTNLYALCLRGAAAGTSPHKIAVLAGQPELVAHLGRNLRT